MFLSENAVMQFWCSLPRAYLGFGQEGAFQNKFGTAYFWTHGINKFNLILGSAQFIGSVKKIKQP